jgi:hypothetical protein
MTRECKCVFCKHFINDKKFTCPAYPDGIPHDVLINDREHDKVLNDQKGTLTFEEKAKQ